MKTRSLYSLVFLAACAHAPDASESTPTRVRSAKMTDFLEQFAATYRFRLGQPGSIKLSPDGGSVLFLRSEARGFVQNLFELDVGTGKERVLLTAEQILAGAEETLSEEEKAQRERMRSVSRGLASYQLSRDGELILVPLSGRLYVFERKSQKVREVGGTGAYANDPQLSPDGKKIACVRDGDLYLIDVAKNEEKRLTTRPKPEVSFGLAEFVAQEEMSRFHGTWWSPDSSSLVYQKTDTTGLETMHIMDPTHPEKPPQSWPYPRPGKKNAEVSLFLMSVEGGAATEIKWNRTTHPYLNTVRWQKNAPLTIVVQNREQTEQLIFSVDPKRGDTTLLHRETDEAWLNIDQEVPRWTADGKHFLWTTERNGRVQLELRSPTGDLVAAVTPLELGYQGLVELDDANQRVIVRASSKQSEQHISSVPLPPKPGAPEMLTSESGIHAAVWSAKAGLWVHSRSALSGQRDHVVKRADGTRVAEVLAVTEKPIIEPNFEILEVQGESGRRYSASVVRPRAFDPKRRYPVFVYVYAGPGHPVVMATRETQLLNQWFADHGFIVVSVDGRGTPGKGRAWERAIKGNFIDIALEDQIDGLRALGKRFPEMDLSRVGIFGWSFGGYFSSLAVMKAPKVFHAAVAGAPVTDWYDYDTHYTERYLGVPPGAAEAYELSSGLGPAKDLGAPLLVMHGTADDNVYFTHAVKLSDALFRAGKRHAFLPLSGFTHMVPDPLITTRLYSTIIEFLLENLAVQE